MKEELRILRLTLHKKPFIEILSGEKKKEYRRYCDHWRSRLLNKDGTTKEFDVVQFTNGYGNDRPSMRVGWVGLRCDGRYIILLGDVLETWRCEKLENPGEVV